MTSRFIALLAAFLLIASPGAADAPNRPPVINTKHDGTILSYLKATLDGSRSGDHDGKIVSFAWTQTAGPSVALHAADTAVATFNAPVVTGDALLRFNLHVVDDKGAAADKEVEVEVFSVDRRQLEVKFADLDYLKQNPDRNAHADYYPVPGPPAANAQMKVVARLSGLIKDVSFEFRDMTGTVIGKPSLTLMGNSPNPPFEFGGDVTIPAQPFVVAAVGNTYDGQNFNVALAAPVTPK